MADLTSNLETSLLRGTEVRELRAEVERLQSLTARMLPYLQEFEPGDAFEIEAQTNLVAEAQKTLAGLPVETGVNEGIKCTHCNGIGCTAQHYDEEHGWSDNEDCATCGATGRIRTVEQYLKTLPANWHEDSSLETWFPLSAEENARYKQALTRANGFLIMHGHEPVKLEYAKPSAVETSIDWKARAERAEEVLGHNMARQPTPKDLERMRNAMLDDQGLPPEKAGENSPFAPLGQIMDRQRDWEVSNQTRGRGCPGCGVQEGHLHMSWCPSRQNSKTEPK